MSHFTYHLKKLLASVGNECIYKDSRSILLVKLISLTLMEEEIQFHLKPVSQPGFSQTLPVSFVLSGNVEFMSFRKNYISHPYVNFLLFTEPGDVKQLVEFAATMPDINDLLQKFRAVMRSTN